MGYALKNTSKHERKLGYQAVEDLLADPNWTKASILAHAKLNEKVFAQMKWTMPTSVIAWMIGG